jgi:hypothetical protein
MTAREYYKPSLAGKLSALLIMLGYRSGDFLAAPDPITISS